ncbi:MAG: CYTH domain-containing protein [Candidatus Saccharibacteria bacterium]|nr:CYTH domain-containing protein [Candidatus Saccharibacteria bacterium]
MGIEIEATFTGIDKDLYREKLKSVGATLKQKELLMRRVVFDVSEHEFARVRDEGNCITMSYKHQDSHSLSGMQEVCVKVDSYDEAINFLLALGFKIKSEQESYREEWELDGVEITIDTWPWLAPYTEIEGPSEDAVKSVSEKLGFNMEDAIYGSVDDVYIKYYKTTSHEVNFRPKILFSEEVGWEERKENG